MAVTATSFKLPRKLKTRIDRLARRSGESPHAQLSGRENRGPQGPASQAGPVARVVYSAEALADLERIIEFLLEASPQSAAAALAQIRGGSSILGSHPRIGRRVDIRRREL
jgi:ParE-like toxin of type II ParDE toxin-antitoxin system